VKEPAVRRRHQQEKKMLLIILSRKWENKIMASMYGSKKAISILEKKRNMNFS
jgi:hypothetical protein